MSNKQEVINLHLAEPTLTTRQISERLNCAPSYVRALKSRHGLAIPAARTALETFQGAEISRLRLALLAIELQEREDPIEMRRIARKALRSKT